MISKGHCSAIVYRHLEAKNGKRLNLMKISNFEKFLEKMLNSQLTNMYSLVHFCDKLFENNIVNTSDKPFKAHSEFLESYGFLVHFFDINCVHFT